MKNRFLSAVLGITVLCGAVFTGTAFAVTSELESPTGWSFKLYTPDSAEYTSRTEVITSGEFLKTGRGTLHMYVEASVNNLYTTASQSVPAENGKKYCLSGDIYTTSTSSYNYILFGGSRLVNMGALAGEANVWKHFEYVFENTAGTGQKSVQLQFGRMGNMYADNLSLREVSVGDSGEITVLGDELLVNGDFESDFIPCKDVTDVSAEAGDGCVTLSWVNPADSALKQINIYCGGELVKTAAAPDCSVFIDGLENGTEYEFVIKTVSVSGIESDGVSVSAAPYAVLPKPRVIKDDEDDVIIGITADMEYSLDEGGTWIVYDSAEPPQLSGNVTVWVRMCNDGSYLDAPVQILHFTEAAENKGKISVSSADILGNSLYVSGAVPSGQSEAVTMLLVREGADRRSFSAVLSAGQVNSSQDGTFEFSRTLPDYRDGALADGIYSLSLDCVSGDETVCGGLVFASGETREEALAKLTEAQSYEKLFAQESEYYNAYICMGLDLKAFGADTASQTDTLSYFAELFGAGEKTQEAAAQSFTYAYVMSAMKNADAERAYQLLKRYNPVLMLSYSDSITCEELLLRRGDDIAFICGYMAGKTYSGAASLNTEFKKGYALYLINHATYGVMPEVIKAQKDILSLAGSDYDAYIQLSGTKRTAADKKMVSLAAASEFKSSDDVKAAMKQAAAAAGGSGSQSSGSGSGGSGGGGGGGGGAQTPNADTYPTGSTSENKGAVTAVQNAFLDLDGYSWAEQAINALSDKGIINGISKNTFAPQANITREEFVKILVMQFGCYNKDASGEFADVSESDWFYSYVASAADAGIIVFGEDRRFGAGENIQRQDMAVMIYRCLNKLSGISAPEGGELVFADDADISDYAKEAVYEMKKYGIISGYEDGAFRPKGLASRAEGAVMCYNAEGVR